MSIEENTAVLDPTELNEASIDLYNYIRVQVAYTCMRNFAYYGKIRHQCSRCRVMERYELAKTGESERKRERETSIKV